MNITGQVTILKDDKGTYKTAITTKELQEDGKEQAIFMRIKVGFRKGVEVKHKTKINIKEGFLTFFRMQTGEIYDDGNPVYIKYPKIIVLDFDVIEEGVDEVYQSKDYSNTQNNLNDDIFSDYSDDELPF